MLFLDDLSRGRRDQLDGTVQVVVDDVASMAGEQAMTAYRPDVIVHCAAQVSVARSIEDLDLDCRSTSEGCNVQSGLPRVRAMCRHPIERGVIYGEVDSATNPCHPRPRSYCAVRKYVAERYLEL